MNLYHLRYFSTLAHIEHYTKAADILAITQPSLSYAISTLEEELGVKLFEKNGRNVTLTKYGKVFLNDVEEVLNRLDSSVNSLKLAGKGEGCIDVVFLRTLGIDFLPKIMRGFLEENPTKKIDFNLYCDKVLTSDILNGLKEKKYDLGFCSKLDNEPLIEFIPVARQEKLREGSLHSETAGLEYWELRRFQSRWRQSLQQPDPRQSHKPHPVSARYIQIVRQ